MADRNIVEKIADRVAQGIVDDLCEHPTLREAWRTYDPELRDRIQRQWSTIVVNTIRAEMNG